jgi:hypothetical protein
LVGGFGGWGIVGRSWRVLKRGLRIAEARDLDGMGIAETFAFVVGEFLGREFIGVEIPARGGAVRPIPGDENADGKATALHFLG